MGKIKCPECKGEGGWLVPSIPPNKIWHSPMPSYWITCKRCKGKGEIDD